MSNNLVSQPMPSMPMAQLEPILNKVDSSGRQMEMGLLGPVSSDPLLRPQGALNDLAGLSRAVPGEPRSQGLPLLTAQIGRVEARPSNIGMRPMIHPPNRQSMQMGTQQLSATPKRKASAELSSGGSVASNKRVAQMVPRQPWLQQGSNTSNRGSLQMQSPSNASRPQHSVASTKRKTQMVDSASSKAGTPRSSNSKNQNTQVKQTPKAQSESSESVRSKMRESLTAALALVSQQEKSPASNNNTVNNAGNSQGKLDDSSQVAGSASASIDTASAQRQDISQSINSSFSGTDSIDLVMGEQTKNIVSDVDFSEKCKDFEVGSTNVSNNENIMSSMEVLNCDKQDFQSGYTLTTDDLPFSDGFFMKDDLLQGNGLSWVLSDMVDIGNQSEGQTNIELRSEPVQTGGASKEAIPLPELLASQIEAELFKLFGGVNKKYKEKGRSLLFNLKDRNNPELRERVMFGQIPPDQLCSMTAEELASKELSEWRIAKAEEFDKMVVLPDSDGDIRRLVKKTHKGEFQVEVDHEDNVPVEEVSGGTALVARRQTTRKDVEATSSKAGIIKRDVSRDGEKINLPKDNSYSITISSNDGTDPMQGLMADDALKDPDFLPPIVSLDEFMESLDSEPPFDNLPVESGKVTPISDRDDSGVGSKSKSPDLTPSEKAGVTTDKSEKLQSTHVNSDVEEEKRVNSESGASSSDGKNQADMKPTDGHAKEKSADDTKSASNDALLKPSQSHAEQRYGNDNVYSKTSVLIKGECLWEGMLQLNISTTHSVISIFKSGEKTSTKGWPGFLDIKGRVRLEAFEKFLQELPQSRTRAIMVLHFVSKGSSLEEQSTIQEVADSYISDERVGFAEPVNGVELYFCPPHKKTVEMLSKILPKEQIEAVNSIDNGLIGVVVWRKANLTSTISPTHKHSSKRQSSFNRRQQDTNVNAKHTHKAGPSSGIKTTENGPPGGGDGDDDDDVPPGFGPGAARVEDDLPEFNFSGTSHHPPHLVQKPLGPGMVPFHSVSQTPSRPADQMRELVQKYGQSQVNVSSVNWQDKFGVTVQPWNDDDDDIPEWKPQTSLNQFPPQQTLRNSHLRPHTLNQPFVGSPMASQYLQAPVNMNHAQGNFNPQRVPPNQGENMQPNGAPPPYGTAWSPHVSRSRRF